MSKTISHETIGCDISDKTSEICVLETNGGKAEEKIRTTPKGMTEFFSVRKSAHVVIEVGAHSRWVSQVIEKGGHRVSVADPRRLKLTTQSNNKTDRRDAEFLAKLGRADETLLSPVTHRDDQMTGNPPLGAPYGDALSTISPSYGSRQMRNGLSVPK